MPHRVSVPMYDPGGSGKFSEENPKHKKLIDYIRQLITLAESQVVGRWPAWQDIDNRLRAYVDVSEWDEFTGRLKYPHDVKIIVPISYAIFQSILTYLFSVFTGREPMFPIEPRHARDIKEVRAAQYMEELLDYDMEQQQGDLVLYSWLSDAIRYGIGAVQDEWWDEYRMRTVRGTEPIEVFGVNLGERKTESREWKRVHSGNRTEVIDPYTLLYDARVPVGTIQRGDFVGYTWFKSWMDLKNGEADGKYENVDHIPRFTRERAGAAWNQSRRFDILQLPNLYQLSIGPEDHGFVYGHTLWLRIVPSEFDLGRGRYPETWVVTVANYDTIVRAERWDYDYGEYPVNVLEYHYDRHSPMNLGALEPVLPLQDLTDWLVDSHMDNVKKAINNMLLMDPSRLNLEDVQRPGPGKWIRTNASAWGQNVLDQVLKQFPVEDVTGSHMTSTQAAIDMMMRATGAVESMLGMQPRTKQQASTYASMVQMASQRHKVTARVMSSQGVRPWARHCVSNIQQNMDEETFVKITGAKAKAMGLDPYEMHLLRVSPEDIQGEFDYPAHTGDIPPDPNRVVEVWKNILFGIAKLPPLAQRFDLVEIFKYMVYAAGVRNIDAFLVKTQVMPDEEVMKRAQAGQIAPVQEVAGNGQRALSPAARFLAAGRAGAGGGPGAAEGKYALDAFAGTGEPSGLADLFRGAQ